MISWLNIIFKFYSYNSWLTKSQSDSMWKWCHVDSYRQVPVYRLLSLGLHLLLKTVSIWILKIQAPTSPGLSWTIPMTITVFSTIRRLIIWLSIYPSINLPKFHHPGREYNTLHTTLKILRGRWMEWVELGAWGY